MGKKWWQQGGSMWQQKSASQSKIVCLLFVGVFCCRKQHFPSRKTSFSALENALLEQRQLDDLHL